MAEVGQVIDINEDKLVVKLKRTEACAKCRACTAGMSSQDMIINALNECEAKKGDRVEITLDDSNFLNAVSIMYGIPCGGFLAGVIIGYYGAVEFGINNGELIGLGLGILFVILSYVWIKSREAFYKKQNYIPKAVKIVDDEENN